MALTQQFGFLDTEYIYFLESQSEAAIRAENAAGVSYEAMFRALNGALRALAGNRDPLIQRYALDTTQDTVTMRLGSKRTWRRGAEYTPGRPELGQEAESYMLPLWSFEIDLGFTNRSLRDMSLDLFVSEVRDTVQGIAKGYRADVLERIFHKEEFPLDSRALTGTSPGFIGAGEPFANGMDRFGVEIPSNYSHYFHGADTSATIQASLNAALAAMYRFHAGDLEILPTEDMAARIQTWTADEVFVPTERLLIRSAIDRPEALVSPERYLGVYAGKYPVLKPEPQVKGINAAIQPANGSAPLRWRYKEGYGRNARVEDRSLFPLTEAIVMQDYGVGVADRFGMALVSAGAGTDYINPEVDR